MAIMIPEKPRAFKPESREDIMFAALEKLPDDYYVVHSYQVSKINKYNSVIDAEADFVVFHRKKGLLCLEAKATEAKKSHGMWYYANNEEMANGGPFNQSRNVMYDIMEFMKKHGMADLVARCKFFHGVWFPIVSQRYVRSLPLSQDEPIELIISEEALYDPEPWLERIFSYDERKKGQTELTEAEAARIVNEVLCPKYNIAISSSFEADTKKIIFHRLLKEQAAILNFLDEQKTAAINGAAGTGKTLVAIEKAKRHAFRGEKVLFLCFNRKLRDHLAANYAHENIDYYTIAGYACALCITEKPDYKKLKHLLEGMWENDSFPYQHVVIDEGQDFGSEEIDEADILELLKVIIEDTKEDGSFFVFYDKLQPIQAKKVPELFQDADCKLTLYRNCRNTENIAKTSLRPISERTPKLVENCIVGTPAKLHFCTDPDIIPGVVDDTLQKLFDEGITDVVILTCKTESESCLADYIENERYPAGKKKIPFSTCRKFKGLEADAVIMVDVDESVFLGTDHNGQKKVFLYYVGASRARLHLDIMTTLDATGANMVLESLNIEASKRPQRDLARALDAVRVMETGE